MLETVGPPAPPTFELNTNGRILKGMRGTFFLGHRLPVASLSRQVARQPNESHRRIRRKKSVMLCIIMVYLHVLCSHWETCVFGLHLVKNLSGIWSNSEACIELLALWRWQLVNNHIIKDQREKILWFGSDFIPHKQPGGNCPLYDTNSINTCRWNTNTLHIRSNIHCMKTAFVEWIMGLN